MFSDRETLLIDAANDAEVSSTWSGGARQLALIVTSHQHFDHWQALQAVAAAARAPTAVSIDADPLPVETGPGCSDGVRIRRADIRRHPLARTHGSIASAGR